MFNYLASKLKVCEGHLDEIVSIYNNYMSSLTLQLPEIQLYISQSIVIIGTSFTTKGNDNDYRVFHFQIKTIFEIL